MAKGLYFYKLHSVYDEDVTKNCKLTIDEIDSNFITLKDADIKDFAYDAECKKLVLTRNDKHAPKLYADISSVVDSIPKNLDVTYDKMTGTLTISYDDKKVVVDGLVHRDAYTHVDSDSTLTGLGTRKKPLGLNIMEKTGLYRPCECYVDIINGEKLPKLEDVKKGDRFITREHVSEYGFLYDYKGVEAISKDLKCGWRIPTKEDWDGMLNAIEPCEYDMNHCSTLCNKELGKLAGKLLKSTYGWFGDKPLHGCGCHFEANPNDPHNHVFDEDFEHPHHGCHEVFDEIEDKHHFLKDGCFDHHPKKKPINTEGVDAFGMHILGAGFSDGYEINDYFGKRGIYWTSSKMDNTDIYVKRFDFNRTGVVQAAVSPQNYLSLRLVKDYDGANFNDVEFINGHMCTCVLMPSLTAKSGYAIWTSNNIGFDECYYHPKHIEGRHCSHDIRYFTTEWNGFTWVKHLLNEGEGAVLFHGLKNDEYQEYRLVKGELISVSSYIFQKVLEEVQNLINYIKELVESNEKRIDELEETVSELSGETEELKKDVDELSAKTEDIEERIDEEIIPAIETLSGDLKTEIERATARENEIYERLISGGTYNSVEGVLTLEAENPINNITIYFNGDYGTL